MYVKIVGALKVLGPSTYEEIAFHLNEEPVRIWKRMSECLKLGLAHRNGNRKYMKSGRQGFVWVAGPGQEDEKKKKHRVLKGPTVQDFSKAINQVSQSIHTQNQLFDL